MNSKLLLCLALVLSRWFSCNGQAAIVFDKGPRGGREIVAKEAGELQRDYHELGDIRMEDVTIVDPHRWYGVRPSDLASGHLLSAAIPGCWRYILLHGTNAVGVATVFDADIKTGKDLRFGSLNGNGSGRKILAALRQAAKLPQIKMKDYEVRLLDVVDLSLVWLHGKAEDILIPLPPLYGRNINAYQPYSESQITKLMMPEAKTYAASLKKLDKEECGNTNAYDRAMTEYEKAHGGNCGAITYYGMGPIQFAGSHRVWLGVLKGKSGKCGILAYKARITFMDETCRVVKQVEILEELTGEKQ